MSNDISIRFYKDHKVRAIWDEKQNQWWFSVLDIVGAINEQDDHDKNRNYWKYLNAKLKKEQNEVVSDTTQLKLTAAADRKKYNTDVISLSGVEKLAKAIPNSQAMAFLDWFKYSENTIDGQSRKKAYTLWESNLVHRRDVGKVKSLQQIHAYLFGDVYEWAGQYRTVNISKGSVFCMYPYIAEQLDSLFHDLAKERLLRDLPSYEMACRLAYYLGEINAIHPFREGNTRTTAVFTIKYLRSIGFKKIFVYRRLRQNMWFFLRN